MEAYKSWVRRNRQFVTSFDSMAYTMTWLLPERFANSELTPETVSTMLGILTVMNRHIIETDTSSTHTTGPSHQLSVVESGEDKSFPWSLCISVMKELEVLTEMAAEHYLGKNEKWGPVTSLEAIKVILRLIIFRKGGYKLLIDGGEGTNTAETTSTAEQEMATQGLNPTQSLQKGPPRRPVLRRPTQAAKPGRDGFNSIVYGHGLEGQAMQAMYRFGENTVGPSRPSWQRQVQLQRTDNLRRLSLDAIREDPINKALVCGEILLICRPLLYASLVWRYGLRSWKPWLAALSIDLTGMSLVSSSSIWSSLGVTRSSGSSHEVNGNSLSTLELLELRKRRLRWAFYVMRSPFFDHYTRRPLDKVKESLSGIPLVGMLAEKAVELLLAVQGLYSYTADS